MSNYNREGFGKLTSRALGLRQSVTSLLNSFNTTIEFMSAGINMFWARLNHILAQAVWRGLKLALRRALNVFMPKNINFVTISIILEGIEKIRSKIIKQSEEYFFHQR